MSPYDKMQRALAALRRQAEDYRGDPMEHSMAALSAFIEAADEAAHRIEIAGERAQSPFKQADLDRMVAEVAQQTNEWHETHLVKRIEGQLWKRWTKLAAVGAAGLVAAVMAGWLLCFLTYDKSYYVRYQAENCEKYGDDGMLRCMTPVFVVPQRRVN